MRCQHSCSISRTGVCDAKASSGRQNHQHKLAVPTAKQEALHQLPNRDAVHNVFTTTCVRACHQEIIEGWILCQRYQWQQIAKCPNPSIGTLQKGSDWILRPPTWLLGALIFAVLVINFELPQEPKTMCIASVVLRARAKPVSLGR